MRASATKRVDPKGKAFHAETYQDYNLVFCLEEGCPVEPKLCENWFQKWYKRTGADLGLPSIILHEVRHSSATYKLTESNGDVKAIQGDLGHSSASMSVDLYSQYSRGTKTTAHGEH